MPRPHANRHAICGGLALALACTPHERAQEPSSPCPVGMALIAGDGADAVASPRVCVDITEVTTAAYGACVHAGSCTPAVIGDGAGCNLTRADRGDHPINCATWAQAQSFCGWLGKRLPDDEEWLRAARGPRAGDRYPWGAAPPDPTRACWDRKTLGTCPVGGALAGASPAGLLDLIGNVGEWTRGQTAGPGGRGRLRGGSWQDSVYQPPIDERSADSARDEPTEAATLASGMRCVVAPLTPVHEVDDSVWTPHRPVADGGLPLLAGPATPLVPVRPLANFAPLSRSDTDDVSFWSLGDRHTTLELAAATAIGLTDPVNRPDLPPALARFAVRRSLGATLLLASDGWSERKYIAVEPAGYKIRWQVDLTGRQYQDLVAPRTLVIQSYGTDADSLVAYALDSGREVWRHTGGLDADFLRIRQLWHDGERGYLIGDRGLVAFDTTTGAVAWKGVEVPADCGVTSGGGHLVVEDPAQGHRLLDADTGALVRRIRGTTGACTSGLGTWEGGTAPAAITGQRLFAFDPPGKSGATLRAFDLATGEPLWRHPQLDAGLLLADQDAVYVRRTPQVVTAIDAATGETRGEVAIGSEYSAELAQVGGAAGPVVLVRDNLGETVILGRAPQPVAPEAYTIRGRLVPDGIPARSAADVPVKVGERRVRTDARGRFEVRGKALGAIGIALGTERGPHEARGSHVRFDPTSVVLTGAGTYVVDDIQLVRWDLY